jgi:endonuclease/exonuclease/phosphatase family metal-dependent hydrolase
VILNRSAVLGRLGCCLLLATASACVGGRTHPAGGAGLRAAGTVRVLQMNLCDSGIAPCYTGGRAVAEAADVIRAERPDVVTLNEVCSDDVSMLARTLMRAEPRGQLISEFKAVAQPRAGRQVVRCRDGRPFGVGLLVHTGRPDRGHTVSAGTYPSQDPADSEKRVWLCVHAIGHFYACTTHLANTDATVALDQCRYLMDTALPALRIHDRADPVVLGADLNLPDSRPPDAQSCMPPGFVRADDGGRQDVMAGPDHAVSGRSISMDGTTDHPGLLVDVVGTGNG